MPLALASPALPAIHNAAKDQPTTSHIAPILPADLKKRIGDLPERADPHRIHQHFEHIQVVHHRLLQPFEHGRGGLGVLGVEQRQPVKLALLFCFG